MPLLLVLAAGVCVWAVINYRQTIPLPNPTVARVLIGLRCLALILLVAAIGAPFVALSRSHVEPAELLVLVEDSASMGLDSGDGFLTEEGKSRWDHALDLCTTLAGLAGEIEANIQPVFYRGHGLDEPQEFQPADAQIPSPTHQGTDLDEFLGASLKLRQGRPLGAVILVSDGCETSGGAGKGGNGLATLGPLGLKRFFVVGVGDKKGPNDRALVDIRYPKVVHRGDKIQVDCVVEQRFVKAAVGDSLTVTLQGSQGLLAAVTIPATGDVLPVTLQFEAEKVGLQVVTLKVSNLDNERFPANNQVSLGISVEKEQARLLLLTTAPSWDVRFLAQAALREPRLVMDVVYPGLAGLVLSDSRQPWSLPQTADDWARYDGVILEFSQFPASLRGVIEKGLLAAVSQGMGLLILPGPSFAKANGSSLAPLPVELSKILPVGISSKRWRRGEFFLTTAAGAGGHPILNGLETGGGSISGGGPLTVGWAGLPPQRGVVPVTVDSSATVLLRGQTRDGLSGPVLVVGAKGRGRVAWFGGDALWETAFWELPGQGSQAGAEPLGNRLLRNLLVWLGIGQDNRGLRIQGDLPLVRTGQRTELVGIWQDLRGLAVADGEVVLQVEPQLEDDAVGAAKPIAQTFALGSPDPKTGKFPLPIPVLPPGRYRLTLHGHGPEAAVSQPEELVVIASSVEDEQVRQDYRRLLQVAKAGHGQYIAMDDSTEVAEMLATLRGQVWSGRSQQLRTHYDLTKGWPFLALMLVLLGLEWYLRRREGLL